MKRFITIKKGLQCELKKYNGILIFKHCIKVKTKNKASTKEVLNSLGIRSY